MTGSRRPHRDAVERECADRIVALLLSDGHTVIDLRRPDRTERQAPAPDFDFLLDGVRTALEITEFTISTADVHAREMGFRMTNRLRANLRPVARELGLGLVLVAFSCAVGRMPTKRRLDAEYARFEASVMSVMVDLAGSGVREVEFEPPVPWVRHSVRVTNQRTTGEPRVGVLYSGGAHYMAGVTRSFIERTVARKAPQTASYARAILGILRGYADAEDLIEGFDAFGPCPWWRVYMVDREGDPIRVHP